MTNVPPTELFHGLFEWHPEGAGAGRFIVRDTKPALRTVPCPDTGLPLRVASLEVSNRAVCPACTQVGVGGYVTFVADLRIAFACPNCRKLEWIAGA